MKYIKLFEQFILLENAKKNCFDNKTPTLVQPLPHNFRRSGKDVICDGEVKFYESKPSILLIPGGDGKPAVDFEHISKDLTGYNLFSMNYDQDQFGSIDTWSQKMAESALNVIPGEFSIVSFSLGGPIGFFAIRDVFNNSDKFTKKIVFIDAGLPEETESGNEEEDFKNHVNRFCGVQNPPQKYNCMRKSKIEESETKALSSKDVIEFRWKFKTPFDMDENEKLEFGKVRNAALFSKLGFDEKEYENWRSNLHTTERKNTMIWEYLDDPKGTDRSHTLVADKPSAVYLNGELIVNDAGKFDLESAKSKMEELNLGDDDIWVVRDKFEGSQDANKQFWWEDPWQRMIFEWTKKHIQNTGKRIGRGEKLPKGVKALYIGAAGAKASPMSEDDKNEITSKPLTEDPVSGMSNTQFEFIEDCTHGNMLEDITPSKKISSLIKEFLKG